MSTIRVLGIVGPTSAGKSTLAEEVALELGGEVVSIDSMQVYRGMDIGTAKLAPHERRCPLHMVDVTDVATPYAVTEFQRDARCCVEDIAARHKVPILCGGTGLYLDAVVDEMRFPALAEGGRVRSAYEAMGRAQGSGYLYALLEKRDPASAREIHPNNTRRVIRALEMLDEGMSYADHHKGLRQRTPHYELSLWAVSMPRERLYARIDDRVDVMFEQGLVDEVRQLEREGLKDSKTASQAIGYKEVLLALDGIMSLDEARELVKRNTRRYAKRQLSWIKRDGRARWIDLSTCDVRAAVHMICDDWRQS